VQAPTALSPLKQLTLSIAEDAGWTPEAVWIQWLREWHRSPPRMTSWSAYRPVRCVNTTLIKLRGSASSGSSRSHLFFIKVTL